MGKGVHRKARKLLYKVKASVVGGYSVPEVQKELDDIAARHENKPPNEKYVLYELQSYIHFANGKDREAKEFIKDAANLKPPKEKFLDSLGDVLLRTDINEYNNVEVPPTKFGGWLILQAIGLVMAPISALGALAENSSIKSELGALSAEGEKYFAAADGMNYFLLITTLITAVYFFSKKKEFPVVNAVFYGALAFVNLFVAMYLAGILNEMGEFTLAGEEYGSILAIFINAAIWVPYYFKSIRVKGTFIK